MAEVIKIPTNELRKLPDPQRTTGTEQIVFFPARAADLPVEALSAWKDVNPRVVKTTTAVYDKIKGTLRDEPDKFYRRNRGITISAEDLTYDQKTHTAELKLADKKLHGVIDGAHTLHAIGAMQGELEDDAFVQMKVILGLNAIDEVVEVAGGLNTSLAVDLKSLENLEGHFKRLQKIIASEPYSDQVAYKMNEQNADSKPIDVREILYYAALFDAEAWTSTLHPVKLFGRKEGIVREFAAEAAGKSAAYHFDILFTKITDILRLRDALEKEMIAPQHHLGKLKARNAQGDSEKIKKGKVHRLLFLDQEVDAQLPLGYIMPMLGGFRANVEWNKPKGSFSWKIPIDELLPRAAPALANAIISVHDRERRPEYVGRSSIAWEMCYQAVLNAILKLQLEKMR